MVSRKCKNTGNRFGNISSDFIPSPAIFKETKGVILQSPVRIKQS